MIIVDFFKDVKFSEKAYKWIVIFLVVGIALAFTLGGKRISWIRSIGDIKSNQTTLMAKVDELDAKVNQGFVELKDSVNSALGRSEARTTRRILAGQEVNSEKIKLVIDYWGKSNNELLKSAIDLRQKEFENTLKEEPIKPDMSVSTIGVKKKNSDGTETFVDATYTATNVSLAKLDSISRYYKVLLMELQDDGDYKVKFKKFTTQEKVNRGMPLDIEEPILWDE